MKLAYSLIDALVDGVDRVERSLLRMSARQATFASLFSNASCVHARGISDSPIPSESVVLCD